MFCPFYLIFNYTHLLKSKFIRSNMMLKSIEHQFDELYDSETIGNLSFKQDNFVYLVTSFLYVAGTLSSKLKHLFFVEKRSSWS